jgi:SAM-dependent methyltransferase
MQDIMSSTLRVYKWPSQAFWRYFEVEALGRIPCERPILEIGCGDGQFSGLVFDEIDEAIDVNPRSVERCRKVSGSLYRNVRCLDVRELTLQDGGFATVYANCVLEHVPEIETVLQGCFRGLRAEGKLVITVPLVRMNDHLLFRWGWYARLRQRQLAHINLLSEKSWEELLRGIGFSQIEFRPYLSGKACKFWDVIDSPGCVGIGRYNLAAIVGKLSQRLLPKTARIWLLARLASWLSRVAEGERGDKQPACAAVVIATKAAHAASAAI